MWSGGEHVQYGTGHEAAATGSISPRQPELEHQHYPYGTPPQHHYHYSAPYYHTPPIAPSYHLNHPSTWWLSQPQQQQPEYDAQRSQEIFRNYDFISSVWRRQYEKLRNYKQRYGCLPVDPIKDWPDISLGNWVVKQRTLYAQNKLPDDREFLLGCLGIDWQGTDFCGPPPPPMAASYQQQYLLSPSNEYDHNSYGNQLSGDHKNSNAANLCRTGKKSPQRHQERQPTIIYFNSGGKQAGSGDASKAAAAALVDLGKKQQQSSEEDGDESRTSSPKNDSPVKNKGSSHRHQSTPPLTTVISTDTEPNQATDDIDESFNAKDSPCSDMSSAEKRSSRHKRKMPVHPGTPTSSSPTPATDDTKNSKGEEDGEKEKEEESASAATTATTKTMKKKSTTPPTKKFKFSPRNSHDRQWQRQYEKLVEFRAQFGHSKVPSTYKPDVSLGQWVKKQRRLHSMGDLPQDRQALLEDIDFAWAALN
jgi:hypothetical protein